MLLPIEKMTAEEQIEAVSKVWDLTGRFPLPKKMPNGPYTGRNGHYVVNSFQFLDLSNVRRHGSKYWCQVTLRCVASGWLAHHFIPVPESMYEQHGEGHVWGWVANPEVAGD